MAVVPTTTVYRGLKAFSNARDHLRSLILGLDPSYAIVDKRHKMYPEELTIAQHHQLCELLKAARFRWILSMPFSLLVHEIYLKRTGFDRVFLPTPHAGHLGRSTTKLRDLEWIIKNFRGMTGLPNPQAESEAVVQRTGSGSNG